MNSSSGNRLRRTCRHRSGPEPQFRPLTHVVAPDRRVDGSGFALGQPRHGLPAGAPAPVAHLVPSCKPGQFARQTGLARGALDVYLFRPYDAGAMRGTGTKAALALLHGGQAVRFSTQQLVAARGSLATCSTGVRPLVAALDAEIGQLRGLGTAFQANHPPGSAAMRAARSSLSARPAPPGRRYGPGRRRPHRRPDRDGQLIVIPPTAPAPSPTNGAAVSGLRPTPTFRPGTRRPVALVAGLALGAALSACSFGGSHAAGNYTGTPCRRVRPAPGQQAAATPGASASAGSSAAGRSSAAATQKAYVDSVSKAHCSPKRFVTTAALAGGAIRTYITTPLTASSPSTASRARAATAAPTRRSSSAPA